MHKPRQHLARKPVHLVFFYKGPDLPDYAVLSLSRARATWLGPVVLLHNQGVDFSIAGVRCEDFSAWYDSREFEKVKESSQLDEDFRSGFWFHAIERFFVLEQWSREYKQDSFVHVELDVDVRCSQEIGARLDAWGIGLFYPYGTHKHAGASFFYSNSPEALALLVTYLADGKNTGDEMHTLWDFGMAHPEHVHILPSHTTFEVQHPDLAGLSLVSPTHAGGLFDLQPFGTWLLGQDPRNSPLEPNFNHFLFEEIGPSSLSHLRFSYDPNQDTLSVRSRFSKKHRVLALHVHSKRFSLVDGRLRFLCVVLLSNLGFRLPLGPRNVLGFLWRRRKKPLDLLYLALKKRALSKS